MNDNGIRLTESLYFKLQNAYNGLIKDEAQLNEIKKLAIEMLSAVDGFRYGGLLMAHKQVSTAIDFQSLFLLYQKYYDDKDELILDEYIIELIEINNGNNDERRSVLRGILFDKIQFQGRFIDKFQHKSIECIIYMYGQYFIGIYKLGDKQINIDHTLENVKTNIKYILDKQTLN